MRMVTWVTDVQDLVAESDVGAQLGTHEALPLTENFRCTHTGMACRDV